MQNLVSSERAALASASFLFKRAISLESLPPGLAGVSSATKLLVNQLQELCSDPFRLDLHRSQHGATTVASVRNFALLFTPFSLPEGRRSANRRPCCSTPFHNRRDKVRIVTISKVVIAH